MLQMKGVEQIYELIITSTSEIPSCLMIWPQKKSLTQQTDGHTLIILNPIILDRWKLYSIHREVVKMAH